MAVFDRDGHFLNTYPRVYGVPADAHHVHVGPDDSVYLVVSDTHQVLKYTTEGELGMDLATGTVLLSRLPSIIQQTCASGRSAIYTSPMGTALPAYTGLLQMEIEQRRSALQAANQAGSWAPKHQRIQRDRVYVADVKTTVYRCSLPKENS